MWRAAKQLPATSFAARRIELNVWHRKDLNRPPAAVGGILHS